MIHPSAAPSNELPAPLSGAPPPTLSVCVVLFRWSGERLETATTAANTLPSDPPAPGESLDAAAHRIIHDFANVEAEYLEQLYTFSRQRHGGREVLISYLGLFSPETTSGVCGARITWTPVDAAALADEMERMVLDYALIRLRAKLGYTNIAFHLVPETFTLSELQQTYESILGHQVDKRNFRRRMIASGILLATQEKRREGSHRPAALYRFASRDDQSAYLTPPWATRQGADNQDDGGTGSDR